jgi:type IV secretion system protein VirB4
VYERFGLNARQIEIIARAAPKRDYYAQTARGNRQFELGLGPIALALTAAGSPDDQRLIDRCASAAEPGAFAIVFLRAKGLPWAADLLQGRQMPQPMTPEKPPPLPASAPSAARRVIRPAAALLNSTAVDAVLAVKPPLTPVAERLSPFRIAPIKPKRSST